MDTLEKVNASWQTHPRYREMQGEGVEDSMGGTMQKDVKVDNGDGARRAPEVVRGFGTRKIGVRLVVVNVA